MEVTIRRPLEQPLLRVPPQRWRSHLGMPGSTSSPPIPSSGQRWPPSHHTTSAWRSIRCDFTRIAPATCRSRKTPGTSEECCAADVDTIRSTNNAIFDDIFWVHLAYITADDGIERLRTLLRADHHYGPVLAGFEAIDQGRRALKDPTVSRSARRVATDQIWAGNLQLLEHEQRAVVQPNFDRLSCTFARLISIGSVTTFEVRGVRNEVTFFTSFYLYSLTKGMPYALRARAFPRMTRFDDRWRWLATSVMPRFQRFDADARLVEASLRRIADVSRVYESMPCIVPSSSEGIG